MITAANARGAILALSLLFLGTAAQPQEVQYQTIRRAVIEERLRLATGKNADRKERLFDLFAQVGCRDERLSEEPVKGSRLPNIVCTMPGATDLAIVVGAHFDQAGSGMGMVDNWSGASLLPTLCESLGSHPRQHTFVFVGFTDEEGGLVGSRSYVAKLTTDQKSKIRAMVNLDSLGLSSTKVEVDRSDRQLVGLLNGVARTMGFALSGVNVRWVGASDAVSFASQHIPAITVHSVTQDTLGILHSSRDTHAALKLDEYYETYRLLTFYLAFLDGRLK